MEQLKCALNRQHDELGAYSEEHLYRLFHGMLDVSLPVNDDGGSYEYTMPLIKNTNHIRVILHHLSGEDETRLTSSSVSMMKTVLWHTTMS